MPAGITKTDQMMYVGQEPWHGLGTKLEEAATAEQAIQAAEMDWNVVKEPVYLQLPTQNDHRSYQEIPGKLAIKREDTGDVFAIMGKGYELVQNVEAFQFFDEVVGEGQAIYHTAGTLQGGKIVWILAKLPYALDKIPGDSIDAYVLLMNSHDGSTALRMMNTNVRVVCQNTLNATGVNDLKKIGFYGKHTKNIKTKADEARAMINRIGVYNAWFEDQVDRMINTQMAIDEVDLFLKELFDFKKDEKKPQLYAEKQDGRLTDAYDSVMNAMTHPTNLVGGMEGTQWQAYNAVTWYLDHEKPVRGVTTDLDVASKRLERSWLYNGGNGLRTRAQNILLREEDIQKFTPVGV